MSIAQNLPLRWNDPTPSAWDESRVRMLRELYSINLSASEIATIMNEKTSSTFSRNAIIGKSARLGLPGLRKVERLLEADLRLTVGNLRCQTIAEPNRIARGEERKTGSNINNNSIRGRYSRTARNIEKRENKRLDNGSLPPDFATEEYDHAPVPDTFLGIPFEKLKPYNCRFPRGEDSAILFCGQPKMQGKNGKKGSSYCRDCHRICHQRRSSAA